MAREALKMETRKSEKVLELLNRQVADWSVLYMKLHHYHWYLGGENFFTLHEKFEQLYNEASLNLDALAERILALGGSPVSTLKDCLSLTAVKEATGRENTRQMVENIANDFTRMAEQLTEDIDTASEARDEPTADMLIETKGKLEKHVWMLKAYLKE